MSFSRITLFVIGLLMIAPLHAIDELPFNSDLPQNPTTAQLAAFRVMPEPLWPVNGIPTAAENSALESLLRAIAEITPFSDCVLPHIADIEAFLSEHPDSPWNPSIRLNLGLIYYREGFFSRALQAFASCWECLEPQAHPRAKALADRSIGEYLLLNSKLGRFETLGDVFDEIESRAIGGVATELIAGARMGLHTMHSEPGIAFRCGPMALKRIYPHFDPEMPELLILQQAKSTQQGTSLWQNLQWADAANIPLRAAFREPGTPIPLPALIHWKSDHYAAVTEIRDGRYHIEDGTFNDALWVTQAAIDDESSGYFLIPDDGQPLPQGWTTVDPATAETIWGRGYVFGYDENDTGPCDHKTGCGGDGRGMAVWNAHLMAVSLNIIDTPIAYQTPVGSDIAFTLRYNQRDANQPSVFPYSNLGPKWTCDWISCIIDYPVQANHPVKHYLSGGGAETHEGFNALTGYYNPQQKSRGILERTSNSSYQLHYPSGRVDVFNKSDGVTSGFRRIFLTETTDPQGNKMYFDYDSQLRLEKVRDAFGFETKIFYEDIDDDLKITRVEDRFGREALMDYDAQGRLRKITDPEGIESEFTYSDSGPNSDFIVKLTTPYGDTIFDWGETEPPYDSSYMRWLQVTGPTGLVERIEFRNGAPEIETNESPLPTPNNWFNQSALNGIIALSQSTFHYHTTYHWTSKMMREMGDDKDYNMAQRYQWLRSIDSNKLVSVLASEKAPLENRLFYNYQGQSGPSTFSGSTTTLPTKIARAINDNGDDTGISQIAQFAYNNLGRSTRMIDPIGRETELTYAANSIDLLQVRQKTSASTWETLVTLTDYANYLPGKITDGSGQESNLTWNARGQLQTLTDPLNRTTTHTYDHRLDFDPETDTPSGYGYLYKIEGPVAGSVASFTYDSVGRVHTTTDSAGHTLTYEYDNLDRPTRITFPDATYEEVTYGRPADMTDLTGPIVPSLDVHTHRDRLGRVTTFLHNAIRQLMVVIDPEGRITQYNYCTCGAINRLIDANGNTTRWRYDIQGRLTKKIYPDDTEITYTYCPHSGRLDTITDALGQTIEYEWHLDNNLASITPVNPINPTPAQHYTWDPHFDRIKTLTDGTGTTTWTYHPHDGATLGAGQVDTITTSFLANSTIAHTYDELGRLTGRTINGTANESSREFDALGRVDFETNRLGIFDYHYVDETSRLDHIDLPHGHSTHFSYETAENDHRLTRIEHRFANNSILSAHDYGHDPDGTITRWTQERSGLDTRSWHYGYDAATRLTSAILKDPTEAILQKHGWQYDPGDNRLATQSGSQGRIPSKFNPLNQLLRHGSGPTRIAGVIDEPGIVTINGEEAKMRNQTEFETWLCLPPGTHPIDIEATDYNENTASQSYEVTIAAAPEEHFEYDLNGNLVERTGPNGTTTYHWDAFDRLIAIHYPDGTSSQFTYDGMSRRVAITEKDEQDNITKERKFLWHGIAIAEERSSTDGESVEKRFFGNGVEILTGTEPGTYTYRTDHLGSIREVVGASGILTARFDYDTWGELKQEPIAFDTEDGPIYGMFDLDFRYTGHFYHASSGLHLAPYRAYDAKLGRWISRDPVQESGGFNLYGYSWNSPVIYIDPDGLTPRGAWNGFQSFFVGNARNIYHGARTMGMTGFSSGARDRDWAGTENIIVEDALRRYKESPCYRAAVNDGLNELGNYISRNHGDAAATRLATGAGLTKALGPKGLVLGAGAINGDFRYIVESMANVMRQQGLSESDILTIGLSAQNLALAYGYALNSSDIDYSNIESAVLESMRNPRRSCGK